jgi:hypothetical protein
MKTSDFLKEDSTPIGSDSQEQHSQQQNSMLREECYHAAQNAIKLHKMLQQASDEIAPWAAEKIAIASDYLKTVSEWLEYELMGHEQDEGLSPVDTDMMESVYHSFLEGADLAWDDPDLVQARKFQAAKKKGPVVIKPKQEVGSRVSSIGPGGKESNVKTDAAWDSLKGVADGPISPAPGWMLRQDPELAKKVKANTRGYKDLKKWAGKDIPQKDHGVDEARGENRAHYDRIRQKNVVPSIDRKRYTDLSGEGLEGPFRLKSGKVVYYDPKAGRYYDRDSDMYLSHEDYFAHEHGDIKEGTGVTDFNPPSQGGTRQQLLAKLSKARTKEERSELATRARMAGASQQELVAAVKAAGPAVPSHKTIGEMTSASVASIPSVGKGSNVGSLFGGSYSPRTPFNKKKATKENIIKRK